MASDKIRRSAFFIQAFSTLAIAYLQCLSGFIYAWPSYTVTMFASNETVLSRPMSTMEISLVGSLTNIGALIATPFCGMAVNSLGRKYSAMLFGLPFVAAWSLIAMTTDVQLILTAVFLTGFGAAGQIVSAVYIPEICQDSIRGAMTSASVACYLLGLLFSYLLDIVLSYQQVIMTHLGLSILYVVTLTILEESPVYLMQQGKEREAAKSIAFYRNVKINSKEVEREIKKIKLQLDPRIDKILYGEYIQSVDAKEHRLLNVSSELPVEKEISSWRFLLRSESSKRALLTVIIVMSLVILMGPIILQVFAEPLFKEAVPSMSAKLCAIFIAIDFLIPTLLCGSLVDRFGRKALLTYTSFLSGCFTLLLGTQLHLHWGPSWVTVAIIFSFCFIYNLGAGTVPFILTAEVFLPKVRGLCNILTSSCMWIMNFVTLMIFNPMVDQFGLGPLFYLFTVICFFCSAYSAICLPETSGLAVDDVQLLFMKTKKKTVSEY